MDLEVISKAFEDSISKCKVNSIGSNSLNNRVKGALNRFAEKTRNEKYEHMQCINNKGEVLFEETDNHKHKVSWNEEEILEACKNQNGDLINTHSHTTPYRGARELLLGTATILSRSDIDKLWIVRDIGGGKTGTLWKSVIAECGNGSRMTLTRIDGTSTDNNVIRNKDTYRTGLRHKFDYEWGKLHDDWEKMHYSLEVKYLKHFREWKRTNKDRYSNSEDYEKARINEHNRFVKDFARNDKEWNNNLMKHINNFKDLGFELSLEWA